MKVNTNLTQELGNEYSVSAWINPRGTHTHYEGAIISSGNWNYQTCWAFGVSQDNTKIDVFCRRFNIYATLPTPLELNKWTHVVSTMSKDGIAKVYVNGEMIYRGNVSSHQTLSSDADNFTIGRESYANGWFGFNGYINDVKIFDHELTETEVRLLSQILILHYPMGSVDGVIGGRNLIRNSEAETGNIVFRSIYTKDIFSGLEGKKITLSFDVKANESNTNNSLIVYPYQSNGLSVYETIRTTITSEYQRVYMTFTVYDRGIVNEAWTPGAIAFYIDGTNRFYLKNIKIELGTQGTAYTPAPEDNPTQYENIIYDTSGYQHNGTVTDTTRPVWNNDSPRYLGSYEFDGTKVITLDSIFYDDVNQCHTVSAWIKITEDVYPQTLINFNRGYTIRFNVTKRTLMYLNDNENDSYVYGSALPLNEWVHITWILDTSAQRCQVYYNGELNASSTNYTSSDVPIGVNKALSVGSNCRALISDFRVYATALSADDVKSLYKTSAYIDQSGTLFSYGLGEKSDE